MVLQSLYCSSIDGIHCSVQCAIGTRNPETNVNEARLTQNLYSRGKDRVSCSTCVTVLFLLMQYVSHIF